MSQVALRPDSQGKVRDMYDLGDRLLIVATDRISAFDYILKDEIPHKGQVLTQISRFWFDPLRRPGAQPHAELQRGRPARAVPALRGLPGRSLHDRQEGPSPSWSSASCAATSPARARRPTTPTAPSAASSCPRVWSRRPSSTSPSSPPSTKAAIGDHDENISYEQLVDPRGHRARHAAA